MMDWMKDLTAEEQAYWDSKPQPEKDWWASNTSPDDRATILRSEISAKRVYERFQSLPTASRDAITARIEKEAREALARLRQRGLIAEQNNNTAEHAGPSDGSTRA